MPRWHNDAREKLAKIMSEEPQHPSDKLDRYIVRFPKGMREHIATLARANGRSINAEIVSRLARSLPRDDPEASPSNTVDALALIPAIHLMVSDLHIAVSMPRSVVALATAIEALALAKNDAERLDRIETELNLNVPDFTKDA